MLGTEVDAIAEGLLKDAEEVKEDTVNDVQEAASLLKCTVCLESFDLDCDLETHMIAHPENNKAVCTLCKKQFKDLKVLKRHVRIHLKKKPFEVKFLIVDMICFSNNNIFSVVFVKGHFLNQEV